MASEERLLEGGSGRGEFWERMRSHCPLLAHPSGMSVDMKRPIDRQKVAHNKRIIANALTDTRLVPKCRHCDWSPTA